MKIGVLRAIVLFCANEFNAALHTLSLISLHYFDKYSRSGDPS